MHCYVEWGNVYSSTAWLLVPFTLLKLDSHQWFLPICHYFILFFSLFLIAAYYIRLANVKKYYFSIPYFGHVTKYYLRFTLQIYFCFICFPSSTKDLISSQGLHAFLCVMVITSIFRP